MESRGAGPTVLVVEDDSSLRVVIRLVLEHQGYQVDEAADGRAALVRLASAAPDLVLADLRMHPIGGLDLIEHMHRRPELSLIPIVLLTGDLEATRTETTADAVVTKPFEPEQLVTVIDRLVRASETRKHRPPSTKPT